MAGVTWAPADNPCPTAACGGAIRNATVGRVVSPGFPGNYSNNLTCHWLLEAPVGHRLHLHFEKVSLAEDDDRFGSMEHGNGGVGAPWDSSVPCMGMERVRYVQGWVLLATLKNGYSCLCLARGSIGHVQGWVPLAIAGTTCGWQC